MVGSQDDVPDAARRRAREAAALRANLAKRKAQARARAAAAGDAEAAEVAPPERNAPGPVIGKDDGTA